MTQQDRPRTSRGHYNKKLQYETSISETTDTHLKTTNFTERPHSRRSARVNMSFDKSKTENLDTQSKQQFIPRPPTMPPREETFAYNSNTSPRKRMYSGYIKAEQTEAKENDDEFVQSDYFTTSHQSFGSYKNNDINSSKNNDAHKKMQYNYNTKPIVKNFNRQDTVEIISAESPERPISSRLSKYSSPLPPISHRLPNVSPVEYQITTPPPTIINDNNFIENFNDKLNLNGDNNEDVEPNENDENSLFIAIRLPNGETIKRYFLKTDLILKIIQYASKKSNTDFSKEDICLLEMPKKTINDFSKSIDDYGLQNRTMLHIIYN